MVDFTKPIRFTRVQNDDHVTYRPRLVGSYRTPDNQLRWVACLRNWDEAVSFVVYDDAGTPINAEYAKDATKATGVFDATLINGPAIENRLGTVGGVDVVVTFDGDKPVRVRFA